MESKDLEVFKIATEISDDSWNIYDKMDWQDRKIIGDQFIRAVDSISANIAQGFGRFHFLDKNKFNYNARGSLFESSHWPELLFKRNKIQKETFALLDKKLKILSIKLNNYITVTKKQTKTA